MSAKLHDREYLGDGLYAEFDGYQIILSTDRASGQHWVALEPDVYEALVRYAERLKSNAT